MREKQKTFKRKPSKQQENSKSGPAAACSSTGAPPTIPWNSDVATGGPWAERADRQLAARELGVQLPLIPLTLLE